MEIIEDLGMGVLAVRSAMFSDDRGTFLKVYHDQGPISNFQIRQVNYVNNYEPGILRGLHAQIESYAEAKLFRVCSGKIQLGFFNLDNKVSGDYILSESDIAVFVPRGYATGYLVLEPDTTVLYCSDNEYSIDHEVGLRYDDPSLNIDWLHANPAISVKDNAWPNWMS